MTSTSTPFDPSQAVRFDLAAGSVVLAAGSADAPTTIGAAVVPANALSALVSAVARSGAAEAAFAAWGEALGLRAKQRLGDVAGQTPEAVLAHVGGEIALAGLGVLGFERWGSALVLTVTGGALGPSGDEALALILRSLMAAATGKPVFTVLLGRSGEGDADPLRILLTGERGAERAHALLAEGASWGLVLAGLHTQAPAAGRLPVDSRPRMSANALVIQKLEGLLARVQRRAQEPRAVAQVAPNAEVAEAIAPAPAPAPIAEPLEAAIDRDPHEAPTTAPPPPEAAGEVEAVAAAAAQVAQAAQPAAPEALEADEAGSVEVGEPMLIPIEESVSDSDLPVVEAVATSDPLAVEGARFVPPEVTPQTDGARTAPPPAPEASDPSVSPADLSFADSTPDVPAPIAAAAAPAREPAAPSSPPPAMSTATVHDASAAATAAAAFAIADADTVDGGDPAAGAGSEAAASVTDSSATMVVEVPVVREAPSVPAPPPGETIAAASATAAEDAPPPTPPLELVTPAGTSSADEAGAAVEEAPAPSSSRRVRGGTVPPIAAVPAVVAAGEASPEFSLEPAAETTHEESGAHAIPERPAAAAELSLQVAGTTVSRAAVPEGAQAAVASFVSAAAPASAPATFGDWLDASLGLG